MYVDTKMINVNPIAKNKPKYEDPVQIINNPQILITTIMKQPEISNKLTEFIKHGCIFTEKKLSISIRIVDIESFITVAEPSSPNAFKNDETPRIII